MESTHPLILQKTLPTVYQDEFLGNTFHFFLLILLLLIL